MAVGWTGGRRIRDQALLESGVAAGDAARPCATQDPLGRQDRAYTADTTVSPAPSERTADRPDDLRERCDKDNADLVGWLSHRGA